MKLLLILPLMAATGLLAADDPEERPSMRSRLSEEIKKHVAYSPPAPRPVGDTLLAAPGDDVVVLEPFTVTTPVDAFAHKIDERRQKLQAERFSVREGGNFLKVEGKSVTTEVKLLYDADHKGWDILSFSW